MYLNLKIPIMIISHNNNKIEVLKNIWTGKEKVLYNGQEMSSKSTAGGSLHYFKVTEDAKETNYEVDISIRWHWLSYSTTVRRNGSLIFSDK